LLKTRRSLQKGEVFNYLVDLVNIGERKKEGEGIFIFVCKQKPYPIKNLGKRI